MTVLSQFAGTSLWFTGNAILPGLKELLHLNQYAVSLVTSAVMLGFIAGTLLFTFLSLADRFSPAHLFFFSSIAGAIFNMAITWWAKDANSLFIFRFITGFFITGIYPVGMKIAADWYEKGLKKALDFYRVRWSGEWLFLIYWSTRILNYHGKRSFISLLYLLLLGFVPLIVLLLGFGTTIGLPVMIRLIASK